MTKLTKLNIISKLNNFSNIQVGEAPTTFYDDNMYPLLYNKYGAMSLQKNDETYLSFTNDTAKLSYMQVIDSIKTKNFQLDCTILLTQIRAENILYAFGINNLFFKISIKNTFSEGIIITSNNMVISANYKFEANKKYNISISKEDDTYTFYINGISHGYKISPTFTNNILAGQNLTFGSNTGTTNTSTSNFRGNLYNLNISYGATLINYNSYTKYGNHLISRQYFGNRNRADTATSFYCNTETINKSPIVWEIPQITNKEEYAVLNNSLFKTKLNGPYTITFNLKPNNVSQTSNLFTYNNYKIILNIVVPTLPEPVVTVNEYTTAALNFENGLVDQIGTTVWTKEGTATVQNVNKIFGENSFETKALGDCIKLPNNFINGNNPYTIEFYMLYSGSTRGSSRTDYLKAIISKNSSSLDNYICINDNYNISGSIGFTNNFSTKIFPNELYKYTITYDGSVTRIFINDKLLTVGLPINFNTSEPLTFGYHLVPGYNNLSFGTIGLWDNINIHDGIATKVRDPDPYEEFLVVDLAFDGENNSTKIVDNARLNERNEVKYNDNVLSLLHFNDNLIDEVGRVWNSIGTTNFSNLDAKFEKSAVFAGNYVQGINDADFIFNNNDFTVELFVKFSSFPSSNSYSFVGNYYFDDGWALQYRNDEGLGGRVRFAFGDSNYVDRPWSPTLNTWYHLAVSRNNGMLYLFVDGLQLGAPANFAHNITVNGGNTVNIGALKYNSSVLQHFYGSLEELRITKGVARYTENFVPSSEPFKYIPKNNWTVNGNAKISTAQKFDGFSSLYAYDEVYTNSTINLENLDFTISFNFLFDTFGSEFNAIFTSKTGSAPENRVQLAHTSYGGTSRIFFEANNNNVNIFQIAVIYNWQINIPYKIDIIRRDNNLFFYKDGILLTQSTITATTENVILNGLNFGNFDWSSDMTGITRGYIKNFKIYKGVAIIPEDPTGKIQLDFDNNVIDKYGNSTWTNNGVTFDQVNSVKGHAAYFNGSDNTYLSTIEDELNFSNNNFVISADFKPIYTEKLYYFFLSTNHTAYSSANTVQFAFGGTQYGCFISKEGVIEILTYVKPVNNQYYSIEFNRNNNIFSMIMNDVLIGQQPTDSTKLLNFNSNGTRLGSIGWGSGYNHRGYIDNFKTYKEDLVNQNATFYNLISNSNQVQYTTLGDSLRLYYLNSTTYFPVSRYAYVLKDVLPCKDYVIEVKAILKKNNQSMCRISANTTSFSTATEDYFGYSFYMYDNIIKISKGGNGTASWTDIKSATIPGHLIDDDFHILKISKIGNVFNLYIDDILYIETTDNSYIDVVSTICFGTNNYQNTRSTIIQYVKMYDHDTGEEIYHRDWKSKIEIIIDKPAVHLPLETNAINTGFAPLTVNSVGSPTYTTIDGKKCIKFEQGKYLTINSNNIFNLGTSSDFYIEMDIYVPSLHTSGYGHSILNNGLPNGTDGMWLQYLPTSLGNDVGKVEIVRYTAGLTYISHRSSNAVNVGAWNSLKFYRKNDKVYIELNDVVSEFLNDINLNFSNGNTHIGMIYNVSTEATMDGYMSNFKMFVGTSEIPETYNDKKVLDLDFKPTGKSYLFKDNNNKCVIHPVNITQRDYQDSQYCYTFNGTNQYLQLGKNDLLNFGLDDFVINIKFKINNFNNNWQSLISCGKNDSADNNKTAISINNNKIWVLTKNAFFIVKDLVLNSNTYYNLVVYRENTKYYLKLNDVNYVLEPNAVTDNRTELADYNYNNNTIIGANLWDGASGYFNGTIYSIKILRNTTDLSLLEDENTNVIGGETEVSYTLSNGFDEVSISKDTITEKSIQIVKDTNKVTAIIDDEILEVPATAGNVDTNDLYLFNEYKGNIKDLRVYNKAFYDKDVFEYDGPYDTELGLIDTLDNEYDEYIMVDQGNYIIKGYFEGIAEPHKWRIYNSINHDVLISGTSINYYYDGVDHLYKDDYKILDMVTNKTYDIVDMGPPGSIKVFINSKVCTDSNFVIRAYRRDSGVFIGEYELDKTMDTYECTIHNLDTTKKYDIMLFDKNNNIESRMMSDRSPEAY